MTAQEMLEEVVRRAIQFGQSHTTSRSTHLIDPYVRSATLALLTSEEWSAALNGEIEEPPQIVDHPRQEAEMMRRAQHIHETGEEPPEIEPPSPFGCPHGPKGKVGPPGTPEAQSDFAAAAQKMLALTAVRCANAWLEAAHLPTWTHLKELLEEGEALAVANDKVTAIRDRLNTRFIELFAKSFATHRHTDANGPAVTFNFIKIEDAEAAFKAWGGRP